MTNTGTKKTVSVIGLGYVGLPLALLASKKGYRVFGIDIQEDKVNLIRKNILPFVDDKLTKEIKDTKAEFFNSFEKVSESDIVIICVPTPVDKSYMPDLRAVESACANVAKHMIKGQLIIIESTINPGVSDDVAIPLLEKHSKMKVNEDFYYAHCPERINPGDKKWSVNNIPRVLGASDEKSLSLAYDFYHSIISGEIKKMSSIKEAEAVKVVENSFRDVNIAFVNELAQSFHHLGIDVVNVIKGAATKPFAFMAHFPGCGVGGHCIPVDPYYLIEYAKKNGYQHDFLTWARRINNQMPKFTVDVLVEELNKLRLSIGGLKIALLGVSYKPNIDDCRESPAFKLLEILEERGAEVIIYDPHVESRSTVKTLKEALDKAEAIVIATGHDEYKKITPEMLEKTDIKVVVDGRNCLDKEDFKDSQVIYRGIGR